MSLIIRLNWVNLLFGIVVWFKGFERIYHYFEFIWLAELFSDSTYNSMTGISPIKKIPHTGDKESLNRCG